MGLDGKVFSGSDDGTIRVWSCDDGTHLHTLIQHDGVQHFVDALVVMRDGTLVSGGGLYVENEPDDEDEDVEIVECAELKMW